MVVGAYFIVPQSEECSKIYCLLQSWKVENLTTCKAPCCLHEPPCLLPWRPDIYFHQFDPIQQIYPKLNLSSKIVHTVRRTAANIISSVQPSPALSKPALDSEHPFFRNIASAMWWYQRSHLDIRCVLQDLNVAKKMEVVTTIGLIIITFAAAGFWIHYV